MILSFHLTSRHLNTHGYYGSYNVAYFRDIYMISGTYQKYLEFISFYHSLHECTLHDKVKIILMINVIVLKSLLVMLLLFIHLAISVL